MNASMFASVKRDTKILGHLTRNLVDLMTSFTWFSQSLLRGIGCTGTADQLSSSTILEQANKIFSIYANPMLHLYNVFFFIQNSAFRNMCFFPDLQDHDFFQQYADEGCVPVDQSSQRKASVQNHQQPSTGKMLKTIFMNTFFIWVYGNTTV